MDLLSSYDDEVSNAEQVPGGASKTTSEISEAPSLQSEWENFEKSVDSNKPPSSSIGSSKVDDSNSHPVITNAGKSSGSDLLSQSYVEDESHLPPGVRKMNRCHSSSSSSEDEGGKDKAKSHSDSDTSCSDDSDTSLSRSRVSEKKTEVKRTELSPPKLEKQGSIKKARHGSSSSRSRSNSPHSRRKRSIDKRSRSRSPRGRRDSGRRRGSRHSRSKDRDHYNRRRRTRSRERTRSDRYQRGGFGKSKRRSRSQERSKRSRSQERSKRSPSPEKEKSKDRSKRSRSRDKSKRSVSKERSLSKDVIKRSVSKDRSQSKDKSKRSLSRDRSNRSVSKDRSKRSASKDIIERSGSKDRSKRSPSKDRTNRSISKDRSKRSVSKDVSKRSRSRERSKRSVSKDKSKRSRSREKSKRSVSKDRSKKRSRSRERRKRSKSRERSKRSRSRERNRRSRSRDRRKRSRSRNRSGSPREARVIRYGDRVIKAGASFGRPPPSKPMTFKEKMRQQLIKTIEEGGDMAHAFTDRDGTVFCTQTAGTQQIPAAKMPPVPLMANLLPPPAGLPAATITASEAAVQSMLALQKETTEKTGVEIPKYYNPAAINPMKYAEQVQKRKLLWSKTKEKDVNSQWNTTSLSSDHDDRSKEKFRKLMGIKQEGGNNSATTSEGPASEEQDLKQKELFEKLDKEYQFARMTTHTHRGVGLGFGSSSYQPHDV